MKLKQILNLIGDDYPKSAAINDHCAVCNDDLKEGGIAFKKLFTTSTFNLNHEFKNMGATHVCSACAVFFSRDNWVAYCERNHKDPYFPEVAGKARSIANWFFFSHYFAKNDHRIVKTRQEWREYLTNPPEPPFCFVISTICKKHLIFKSEMAYNRDEYPIRFEDKMVYINREEFSALLEHFEALYQLGLNKSSIRTGEYNSSALLKIDMTQFWPHENEIKPFRTNNAGYLAICEFIGAKDVS